MNSNSVSSHSTKLVNSRSSQDSDIVEIKNPNLDENSIFRPQPILSYKRENEQKHEYYSSASARPDLVFYSKVKIEPNDDHHLSSSTPRTESAHHSQFKRESLDSYSSFSSRSENECGSFTDGLIDYGEFAEKAGVDFQNFIPQIDLDLSYQELKTKHPKLIKEIERTFIIVLIFITVDFFRLKFTLH